MNLSDFLTPRFLSAVLCPQDEASKKNWERQKGPTEYQDCKTEIDLDMPEVANGYSGLGSYYRGACAGSGVAR